MTSPKVFFNWKQVAEAMDYIDQGGSIQNALSMLTKKYNLNSAQHRQINGILLETYRRLNTIDRLIKLNIPNQSMIKLNPVIRAQSRIIAYLRIFKPNNPITEKILSQFKNNSPPAIKAALNRSLEEVYSLATNKYEELSYKYFFPPWMVSLLINTYGENTALKIMETLNIPPATFFRINPFKIEEETVLEILSKQNFVFEKIPSFPFFYKLISSTRGLPSTELFKEGKIIIQDLASARAAFITTHFIPKNGKILDMCSAPGSKLTYIKTLSPTTETTAIEFNNRRINILNQRINKIKISQVKLIQADSRTLPFVFYHKFDTILLDPPCTGLGTIGSHPEIKWRLKKRSIKWYTKNQYLFLKQAVKHIKKEGHIVYSTCTLTEEENIEIINKITNEHHDIQPVEYLPEPKIGQSYNGIEGIELILPYHMQTEGFFIATLKKK